MASNRARGRYKRFKTAKAEYIWIATQSSGTSIAGGPSTNSTALVVGSDWERGGADTRQVCTLVRTVISWRAHSADIHLFPVQLGLLVQDEDEAGLGVQSFAANGDERWLRAENAVTTAMAISSTGSSTVHASSFDIKQRLRIGNNDELRFLRTNTSTTIAVVEYWTARCLLRLS